MDTVRVLRIIEYVGPRDRVEQQLENSLHGTKSWGNGVTIRVATIGSYPEILASVAEEANDLSEVQEH